MLSDTEVMVKVNEKPAGQAEADCKPDGGRPLRARMSPDEAQEAKVFRTGTPAAARRIVMIIRILTIKCVQRETAAVETKHADCLSTTTNPPIIM